MRIRDFLFNTIAPLYRSADFTTDQLPISRGNFIIRKITTFGIRHELIFFDRIDEIRTGDKIQLTSNSLIETEILRQINLYSFEIEQDPLQFAETDSITIIRMAGELERFLWCFNTELDLMEKQLDEVKLYSHPLAVPNNIVDEWLRTFNFDYRELNWSLDKKRLILFHDPLNNKWNSKGNFYTILWFITTITEWIITFHEFFRYIFYFNDYESITFYEWHSKNKVFILEIDIDGGGIGFDRITFSSEVPNLILSDRIFKNFKRVLNTDNILTNVSIVDAYVTFPIVNIVNSKTVDIATGHTLEVDDFIWVVEEWIPLLYQPNDPTAYLFFSYRQFENDIVFYLDPGLDNEDTIRLKKKVLDNVKTGLSRWMPINVDNSTILPKYLITTQWFTSIATIDLEATNFEPFFVDITWSPQPIVDFYELYRSPATYNGNDLDTVLLLHFDGEDGQITTEDDSVGSIQENSPITFEGNAQLSTDQFKFGTTSLKIDSFNDAIIIPDNPQFDTEVKFTWDFWIFPLPGGGNEVVFNKMNSWKIYHSSGSMYLEFPIGTATASLSLADNIWQHVAITFDGSQAVDTDKVSFFIDGIQQTTSILTGTMPIFLFDTSNFVRIGSDGFPGTQFNGYLDEVRFSKVVRYFSNFTPETSAYSIDFTSFAKIREYPIRSDFISLEDNNLSIVRLPDEPPNNEIYGYQIRTAKYSPIDHTLTFTNFSNIARGNIL